MSTTFHPDFPKGTPVIGIRPGSSYFGQRGEVYGAGPNSTGSTTLVWVRWEANGDCLKHLPKHLSIAALDEAQYKTHSRTTGNKKVTQHTVPTAGKRARPTIFQHKSKSNLPQEA